MINKLKEVRTMIKGNTTAYIQFDDLTPTALERVKCYFGLHDDVMLDLAMMIITELNTDMYKMIYQGMSDYDYDQLVTYSSRAKNNEFFPNFYNPKLKTGNLIYFDDLNHDAQHKINQLFHDAGLIDDVLIMDVIRDEGPLHCLTLEEIQHYYRTSYGSWRDENDLKRELNLKGDENNA